MRNLMTLFLIFTACSEPNTNSTENRFDMENDLLLAQFDCKTDVDDLHTVAALATLFRNPPFANVNYHAVAGTYGIQEGLYVPANALFREAFGDNWSDAHADFEGALEKVVSLVRMRLEQGGDIWIAEAGQSDFSAAVVNQLQQEAPDDYTLGRIHIIQHSDWNEQVTSPESLAYVKKYITYHKIPDGNVIGNGTPGFRSEEVVDWRRNVADPNLVRIWELAISIGNSYNGQDGRYYNEAIGKGGVDFSDLSETCWIFGLEEIADARQFFEEFGGN